MKRTAAYLAILLLIGLGIWQYVFGGHLYMGADIKPGHLEEVLAMKVVDSWIAHVKPAMANPVAPTKENLLAGSKLYQENCAGCHGDQKHPHSQFGLALYPPAPQFQDDPPDMTERDNFVVINHGTRWTGMPAWKGMLTEQQIWTLTTFLSHMRQAEDLARPAK